MNLMRILQNKEYLRSILFGIEDSLVSTTGLVAGISIGADSKSIVLLAGFVGVAIEAVSMGAGEYLSDDAVKDLNRHRDERSNPLVSGLYMLVSYFVVGFIPIAPFMFLESPYSLIVSVTSALISLFLLGYIKGTILKTSRFRSGVKIFLVGGVATIIGLIVGVVLKI